MVVDSRSRGGRERGEGFPGQGVNKSRRILCTHRGGGIYFSSSEFSFTTLGSGGFISQLGVELLFILGFG